MHRGERIGTRWEIGDVAGSGGMGVVYRATDLTSGGPVAVKVLLGESRDTALRFQRETEILVGLGHPNLARRLDAGTLPDGTAYLVLEWIEGMSLYQRLAEGRMPVLEALQLGSVLAAALAVVHADGVVHRDLKPTNVLLRGGNLGDPVLIDFGIARRGEDALTRTGLVVGTPSYMAPEQAIGDRGLDARADIFSLGCLLYECLTGRAPFAAPHLVAALTKVLFESPAPIRPAFPEVPESVEALVMRMLSKDRTARPRDGAAVAALLQALIADVRALGPGDEPLIATQPRSLLTAAEQRIVSVILLSAAEAPSAARGTTEIIDEASAAPTLERGPGSLPSVDVLNRVRQAVAPFGAHADGLLGGVVLVKAPAGEVATDHATTAARCALALRTVLPEAPMSLAVGRARLQEGTLAGSVIDEAASLLHAAPPDPRPAVRVNEVAAGLLDASFDVRGDAVSLLLLGERELAVPAAPRPVRGVSVPFVGRRRELGFIEGLLEECRQDRRAQAVLVTAPPGLGKSRLVNELLRRLAGDSTSTWWCAAEPTLVQRPFTTIGRLVAHAAQLRNDEPAVVRTRKLRARFGRALAAGPATRTVDVLAELLPANAAPGESTMDEETVADAALSSADTSLADRARVAWLELVEAESRNRPLVLVVDDFHWVDDRSVRLLEAALRTCENQPLTIIAAGRPEAEERSAAFIRDARVQVLKMGRLPDEDARAIVHAVSGAEAQADDVGALLAQSQGNAFFLEELLRARWQRDARLPDTLLAAVDARIDALSPLSRRLIRAASVFGDRFWEPAIQEMAGSQSRATAEAVQELIDEELVTEDADSEHPGARQLAFRHALVREAAYARLTEDDWRRGHRLAGMWLQRRGVRAAAVVARHLQLGAEPQRAALWHALAAEQALERGDGRAAVWHTENATEAPDGLSGRLLALEGIARHDLGDGERSLGCLTAALQRLPPRSADWCNALGLALPLLLDRRRTDEAVVLCRQLLDSAQSERTPAVRAAAARSVLSLGIHEGRSELTAALLAIADGPGSEGEGDKVLEGLREGYLALGRSQLAARRGDLGQAVAASEAAVVAFQRAGNLRRQANALNRLGDALKSAGAYEEALVVLDQGLELVRRLGIAPTEATITSNRSWVLAMLGRTEEAVVEAARALDICTRVGIAFGVVYCRAYLARALLVSGAVPDAERHARLAVEAASGAPNARPFAQTTLAEVLLRSGDAEGALAQVAPAIAEAQGPKGMDEGDALAHLVHAEALHALGRQAEATAAIEVARTRVEERAVRITDPSRRMTFLSVPEHRRTLDLAGRW